MDMIMILIQCFKYLKFILNPFTAMMPFENNPFTAMMPFENDPLKYKIWNT